jgi:hypothetical protein
MPMGMIFDNPLLPVVPARLWIHITPSNKLGEREKSFGAATHQPDEAYNYLDVKPVNLL